jgi:hypothetical protein
VRNCEGAGEVVHSLLDVVGGPSSGLARRELVRVPLEAGLEAFHQRLEVAGVDQLVGAANERGIGGFGHRPDRLRPAWAVAHAVLAWLHQGAGKFGERPELARSGMGDD